MASTEPTPMNIASEVDRHLIALVTGFHQALSRRIEPLQCFARQGVQVEGWLKGELLTFLTVEKDAGRLQDFAREECCGTGKRKSDLKLSFQHGCDTVSAWVELKHHLIGVQKGITYNAFGYFNDPCNGVKPDVEKLLLIPALHKYLLILATARPDLDDWKKGIERFNSKFLQCLMPLTHPEDLPKEFFLGLVRVNSAFDSEAIPS